MDIHAEDVPASLRSGPVDLLFEKIVGVPPEKGLVPYCHFKILVQDGKTAGHINVRLGDTDHVVLYAGHVGFAIDPSFRGHSYACHACRALIPFLCSIRDRVILTANPDNGASIRTIEKLGGRYLGTVNVPDSDPAHASGARFKRRYEWVF